MKSDDSAAGTRKIKRRKKNKKKKKKKENARSKKREQFDEIYFDLEFQGQKILSFPLHCILLVTK